MQNRTQTEEGGKTWGKSEDNPIRARQTTFAPGLQYPLAAAAASTARNI